MYLKFLRGSVEKLGVRYCLKEGWQKLVGRGGVSVESLYGVGISWCQWRTFKIYYVFERVCSKPLKVWWKNQQDLPIMLSFWAGCKEVLISTTYQTPYFNNTDWTTMCGLLAHIFIIYGLQYIDIFSAGKCQVTGRGAEGASVRQYYGIYQHHQYNIQVIIPAG
jgi:hypothetical protein